MTPLSAEDGHRFVFDETPEQAALAISDALVYLRREADAIGMYDIGVLIELASAKAGEAAVDFRLSGRAVPESLEEE